LHQRRNEEEVNSIRYLVLGAAGMAGHMMTIYLQEQGHSVTAIAKKTVTYAPHEVCDVRNLPQLDTLVGQGKFDIIVNCTGILNRDAEMNMADAVFINSFLPHHLSQMTKDHSTQVIHLSTDCVFSGLAGGYQEHSLRDGQHFYDRSKSLGEIDNDKDLTLRTSVVGPDLNQNGIGLFNWFMNQPREINGYTRAIWTGVTTLVLARAVEQASRERLTGLYHLVNGRTISKYELLTLFNKHFRDHALTIRECDEMRIDKSLINSRDDFDFIVPPYEEMIVDMKTWMTRHRELYPHYYEL
jgi:dTDP-4-dehydrorhamnose reductase